MSFCKGRLYRRDAQHRWGSSALALCIVLLALLCSGCDSADLTSQSGGQSTTFTGSSTHQQITYGTASTDVLIRTFYGGGLQGTLNLSPQISVYGDGTYILGLNREGRLDTDKLQQLLNTLVDSYGLLAFKRQQFFDIPDQNATFLDLTINGKHEELMYGAFGSQPANAEDKDEFQRLGKALDTLKNTLVGPFTAYQGKDFALLARQMFSPDPNQTIPDWPLKDFTLAQAATLECGLIPADNDSTNPETACLKFVIPSQAILLTPAQVQTIKAALKGQGVFFEEGLYYTVMLRPLLPDELPDKTLAMFGSQQVKFTGVPLHAGTVPPVPTATPSR